MSERVALIVGAGAGLSGSLARVLSADGMRVALAARDVDQLRELTAATGAKAFACDATEAAQVNALFAQVRQQLGTPSVVVYNASRRARGPIETLDPDEVHRAWMVSCFGGFLVAQHAVRDMLAAGTGSILFTGATASVKAFPQSAAFAMGKFGLRALAQSMARELAPKNIHVAHVVIDGVIAPSTDERTLHPDAIAREYLHLIRQPRSAWSWEIEVRPSVEPF
jgi:NAD(P)-dependent dehydrogenase (short-subunit alcohol dehydrogenase family)